MKIVWFCEQKRGKDGTILRLRWAQTAVPTPPTSGLFMKILFLCKRQYMSHDVIRDRYGRLYHVPNELSLLGHDVQCCCLSYRHSGALKEVHNTPSRQCGVLSWCSGDAGAMGCKIPLYLRSLYKTIQSFQPDIILGSSDLLHTIIARIAARVARKPYFIDLYDNYESFGMRRLPGMIAGYREALRNAAGVFTVSDALRKYISRQFPGTPVVTIESTIVTDSFAPMDKSEARQLLSLPLGKPLIGTAGSLSTNRGTEHLYKAFFAVKKKYKDSCLVLAGPVADNPPPAHPDIIYLGEIPHSDVPKLFNAMDIAVICMKDDNFGRYAFPQKAYEILACQVPLVCASVGSLKDLLAAYPECLYTPDDVSNLAVRLLGQMGKPVVPDIAIPSWSDQAKKIERTIMSELDNIDQPRNSL